MVLPSEWTFRKSSKVETTVIFDGVDDLIDLGNQASLWSQSLTKFSFSFWIYPTIGWDGNDRIVVSHGNTSNLGFRCNIDTAVSNRIKFMIKDGAAAIFTATNDTLVLNTWNFVTCVYDSTLGSGNIKIYVNGVVGTNADLAIAINLSATLTLSEATTDFKGNMKDFKWWTTTALTAQNVLDLYNGLRSLAPIPNYWQTLNENFGSPTDQIGSGLTGTFTGGSAYNTMSNAPINQGLAPDLGGTGLLVQVGENNIFEKTAFKPEIPNGSTKYRLFYIRYIGSEQPVKDCSFVQPKDTPDGITKVEWCFDPSIWPTSYRYGPSKFYNGTSDFDSTVDAAPLDLTKFTIAAWFRTVGHRGNEMMICNKGGIGSDTAGQNDNYSLMITGTGQIQGGFEETTGTDHYAVSPLKYDDGVWHFAVVTYDQVNVNLYVDDMINPVAQHATATSPEQNAQPLVVGRNSRASDRFFFGDIDQVRVFNTNISSTRRTNLKDNDLVAAAASIMVYEQKNGTNDGTLVGQTLINECEEPWGTPVWQAVSDQIPSPANIGEFKTNMYVPIILRYTLFPNTIDTSIENDTSIFRVHFAIQANQTGGGDDNNGQTPSPNADTVIIYNGDWGEESQTTTMVNAAKNENPNMVLSGGDDMYASSATQFLAKIKPIDNRQGSTIIFESAIGNHDDSGDINGHFGYAHGYHSHRISNFAIVFIDTENSPTGSAQKTFIDTELDKARKDNQVDWIIVCFHRPIYTANNSHHSADEGGLRTTYMPMFQKYKVDLVCQSHVHSIQRTYPVIDDSANSPDIQDSSAGPYADWKGVIFAVDGTGGHDAGGNLYKLSNTPAFNAYQNDSTNMNLKLATTNNGKTLTCSFIDAGGSVKHSWVMTRS